MTVDPILLAHAGEGATWQALVVTLAIGVVVVLVLAVAGRLRIEVPGDLVVPLAFVAIVGTAAPGVSETLSDWIGTGIPAGAVALVTLVLGATTRLELDWRTGLGAAVVAVVAVAVLNDPLTDALHPPEPPPATDDAAALVARAP